jgi:hypothetical protein
VAARVAASPGWYAPVYGLFCGLLVAGGGLPQPWGSLLVGFSLLGIALLYLRWQQMTGLSVNGYRAGTTRVIAIGLAVAFVSLMLAGLALRAQFGFIWAPILCGAVAGIIAFFASAAWDRAWQRELRSSGDAQ